MSILTVVVTVAVLLWAAGLVVTAVTLGVRFLRQRASGEGSIFEGPQIAMLLLVGIGGILVAAALMTAALVTEREAHLIHLHAANAKLDAQVRLYESHLASLEQRLEAAKRGEPKSDRLVNELRQEISELRQRLASLH